MKPLYELSLSHFLVANCFLHSIRPPAESSWEPSKERQRPYPLSWLKAATGLGLGGRLQTQAPKVEIGLAGLSDITPNP